MRRAFVYIALIILSVILFTTNTTNEPNQVEAVSEPQPSVEVVLVEPEVEPEPVAEPEPEPESAPANDPQGCEPERYWAAEYPHYCIDKKVAQKQAPAPNTGNAAPSKGGGVASGSCHAEIAKYSWNKNVATAVMLAESGGDPGIVNDNPRTGDYSVGCFQINIIGSNAKNRPSESELKNAAVNVAFAWRIYSEAGHTFAGDWGAFTNGSYRKFL